MKEWEVLRTVVRARHDEASAQIARFMTVQEAIAGACEAGKLKADMRIASHHRRLRRLEASRGTAEQERLFFDLSDWAQGCPKAFESKAEQESLFPKFETVALDNLVAAGKIRECDRERVVFMVRILVSPPKRDDGYQAD